MYRLRRDRRRTGTNAAGNATSDSTARGSDETTRTGTDSWNDANNDTESNRASRNTANESDHGAGNHRSRTITFAEDDTVRDTLAG